MVWVHPKIDCLNGCIELKGNSDSTAVNLLASSDSTSVIAVLEYFADIVHHELLEWIWRRSLQSLIQKDTEWLTRILGGTEKDIPYLEAIEVLYEGSLKQVYLGESSTLLNGI